MSLLFALALGLAPLGLDAEGGQADPQALLPLEPADLDAEVQAGPLAIAASSEEGILVETPVLDSLSVPLCDACPLVQVGESQDATPATQADPGPFGSPWPGDLTTPQAVAATSASALALGILAWLAPRLLLTIPFFGFSRIDDGKLARHPKRQLALQLISANPGCNLQELRQGLGLAWGTTVYHMSRLEKAGLVAVRHIAGQRTHWPIGGAPPPAALPATGRALASLVQARPGLDQRELAHLLGVGAATACKQLARLESAGLVLAQRVGHSRRYVGTARLAATPML